MGEVKANPLRSLGFRFLMVFIATFWLVLVASTWAKAAYGNEEDDNYNFSWLDPDKKIYVLQNRKYLKSGKLIANLMGGIGLTNPYRNNVNIDPRFTYYFNETWGVEAFFTFSGSSENNNAKALFGTNAFSSGTPVMPVIREVKSQMGGLLHFAPWYAKINVFNSIIYFDWYFTAGFGQLSTRRDVRTNSSQPSAFVAENFFGGFVGTGHLYHLTQMWAIRMDLTGSYFQAPLFGATGEKTWVPNYNIGLGIALKL